MQGPKPFNAMHSSEHIHSSELIHSVVSILSPQEGTWTLESCVPPPTANLIPVSVDLLIHETVTIPGLFCVSGFLNIFEVRVCCSC